MIPMVLRQDIAKLAIREFVAHSYLYYELANPVIPDSEYDNLEYWICDNQDWIRRYDTEGYLLDPMIKGVGGSHLYWKVKGEILKYAESLITQ